tara:strand:+ start:44085 stop:44540 length:456 start_codon:yes stop_codon:yes gene_type:complete
MADVLKEIKQTKLFANPYQEATINLIFTGKWMVNMHNEIFRSHGISFQQYNILRILRGSKKNQVTLKYIKERMLDKRSDTSRVVDLMVKKDILERQIDPNDRRKVAVSISDHGIKILDFFDTKQEELFGFLSHLSEEEIRTFNLLLTKARG